MKGVILANCGAMGLNWERLSLSGYIEALEAANEMNDPDAAKKGGEGAGISDRLKSFIAAHGARAH